MKTGSLLLWQIIVKDLEEKIASSEIAPGAQLPTENKLAERYKVNRHTVRRAIQELVMQNLVEVTQGRGSFVCRTRTRMDYTKDIYAPSTLQIVLAKKGHGHESSVRIEPATARMAKALQIQSSRPVAVLDFLINTSKGEPLALTSRSLPLDRVPKIMEAFDALGSLPKALEQTGVRQITRKWVRTHARMATAEERTALGIDLHTPLLMVGCLFVDQHGQPVLHDCSLFAADRVEVYSHNVSE